MESKIEKIVDKKMETIQSSKKAIKAKKVKKVAKKKIQKAKQVTVTSKEEKNVTQQNETKELFQDIVSCISSLKEQLSSLNKKVKYLESNVNKKMRKMEKENKKSKNKGNRAPSGFANPTNISKQLCEFMDKPLDTKMARTDVTKYIINYIKKNHLEDPQNARVIKPNTQLKSLLNISDNDEALTYFNIQRHMNKHFLKSN